MTVIELAKGPSPALAKPMLEQPPPRWAMGVLVIGVAVPFLALLAAIPMAWGRGLSWLDVAIALVFYFGTGFGVTVGFHRYFTHGAFKAKRWLRITLAVAGSMAIEGAPIIWVADHRRHHAYADREGDPHSPWRYGATVGGLAKGLLFAHIGWLFRLESSNRGRFAPDLLADRDIMREVLSFGESWHNSHHADPTCARHGVLPGQVDSSARVIWLLEKAGWVSGVRWRR